MEWNVEKIPNSERFTMTSQKRDALHRTLLCHASLIEDLLSEGYRCILTSRFQSDLLYFNLMNIIMHHSQKMIVYIFAVASDN